MKPPVEANLAMAWLGYAALRLGRCGVAGLALLFACAGVAGSLALRPGGDVLARRIELARTELQQSAPVVRPALTAQAFLAQLPGAQQVPQFIEAVHRQAQQAGVQIERAEYRAPALAGGQVLRSQVVLPLAGSYPAITRWLGQIMFEHPSAAIDEISLQRDAATGDAIRARVVLSHYSRVAP